ncbi:MAG: hypothetical protein HY843_03790 [Bdellovibrio sp.]|nr:hypothetical protein [Bdellovibrio sp.]
MWKILFLFVFYSYNVFAYIPPTEFILKTLAKKHEGAVGLFIKHTVSSYNDNKPTGISFTENIFVYNQNRVVWCAIKDAQDNLLYFDEHKSNSLFMLLFDDSLIHLKKFLETHGIIIPTSEEQQKSFLARFKNNVAWVIGEKTKQLSSQLWIEKDVFLPFKIQYSKNEEWFTFGFEGFRFYKEFPYPTQINLTQLNNEKESSLYEIKLKEIQVFHEQKAFFLLKEKLFGKTSPHHVLPYSLTVEGKKLDSKLIRTIEDYYKKINLL